MSIATEITIGVFARHFPRFGERFKNYVLRRTGFTKKTLKPESEWYEWYQSWMCQKRLGEYAPKKDVEL